MKENIGLLHKRTKACTASVAACCLMAAVPAAAAPAMVITNPSSVCIYVPYTQTQYRVVATNAELAGWFKVIVNHAATTTVAQADPFSVDVPLALGPNVVKLAGTNTAGTAVSDVVMINRLSLRGSAVGWGLNDDLQTDCPVREDYVMVAGGESHSLALLEDRSLLGWGANTEGQIACPAGSDYMMVAAGAGHSLAVRTNFSLAGWGRNTSGQASCPAGNLYAAVAGGGAHSLALCTDGSLVAWGGNGNGQTNCPGGSGYVAVAAGLFHSLALRADGTLMAWGTNNFAGVTNCPPGSDYIAIAAGGYHNIALRANGALVAWGDTSSGQTNCPPGTTYAFVGAGLADSCALRQTYDLAAWGDNTNGETNAPAEKEYTALAAGANHNLAIRWVWPVCNITNVPDMSTNVGNDVTTYAVAGTSTVFAVGDMWVSNTAVAGAAQSFSGGLGWTAPAVNLNAGTNVVRTYCTNVFGAATNEEVLVFRGPVGTGRPYLDVTNAAVTLPNDVTAYAVAGTNNIHVVVGMWVSNATVGGARSPFVSAASWTAPAMGLAVGANVLRVYGTNAWNIQTNDAVTITRGAVGTGTPFLNITNAAITVPNDRLTFAVAGTNNIQVVGGMWVSNAANAVAAPFAAAAVWTTPALSLSVGANIIWVTGTNAFGTVTNDTVTITRGAVGTGTPFVDVTNALVTVPNDMPTYAVAGTNNIHVVGGMWASNTANAGAAPFASSASWTAPALSLNVGTNIIWVTGTNALGVVTNDAVVITRAAAGVPAIAITNAPPPLPNDALPFVLAGTNNIHVVGGMWVSNATVGGPAQPFAAAASWTAPPMNLAVGPNLLVVYGTNIVGDVTSDSAPVIRGPVGTGRPYTSVTTTPALVSFDVTDIAIAGTNNIQVMGGMWVTNAAVGGPASSFPAAPSWTTPPIPLAIGPNMLRVVCTNTLGLRTNDTVLIVRGGVGTGRPFVDITNDTFDAHIALDWSIAGTNNLQVVGDMWISNAANGQQLSFPAAQSWTSAPITLLLNTNVIYVFGSNLVNQVTNDTMIVMGIPEASGVCCLVLLAVAAWARRGKLA